MPLGGDIGAAMAKTEKPKPAAVARESSSLKNGVTTRFGWVEK